MAFACGLLPGALLAALLLDARLECTSLKGVAFDIDPNIQGLGPLGSFRAALLFRQKQPRLAPP